MSESEFQEVQFFGGAIIGELPKIFEDASKYREVPDAQEVYISQTYTTDINVIIDILQRHIPENMPEIPTPQAVDEAAVREHFEDTIDTNREGRIIEYTALSVERKAALFGNRFPADTPVYQLIGTVSGPLAPPMQPVNPEEKALLDQFRATFTALYMTIIRLEDQKTDLVLTINVPYQYEEQMVREKRVWHPCFEGPPMGPGVEDEIFGANGLEHKMLDDAVVIMDRLLRTFKIVDWELFSPED